MVKYQGMELSGTTCRIASDHLEAILKAPKAMMSKHMLSFLGMAGYSCTWIVDYALKTQPLRDLVKNASHSQSTTLQWNEEAAHIISVSS